MAVPRSDGGDAAEDAPEAFAAAVASLRHAAVRAEVVVEPVPAPHRLAPWSYALSAEVVVDGEELATGRLVLLHDPAAPESWSGDLRLVTHVRTPVEREMVDDPMLAGVGWDWLLESLESRGARFVAASGTITRVASESFGAMAGRPDECEVEVRASWTPVDSDLTAHLEAWCELLCTTAGLPPPAQGVTALAARRPRNGRYSP